MEIGITDTTKQHYWDRTLGQWTVKWWRWAINSRALDDMNGEHAAENQDQQGPVFFLAGTWADKGIQEKPTRKVAIPSKKAILFPVINCEADPILYPFLKTDEEIIKHVEENENSIVRKDAYLDGQPLKPIRVKSDPLIFEIRIDGQDTRASADGFYVLLKPLPKGQHRLSFGGECMQGKLKTDVVYELEIK